MIRRIIKINEKKCNGCGLCANACHEGAIKMENGIAKLIRDDYCDGLGDCLPVCPTGAISFEERDTLAYDEQAVKENMKKNNGSSCHCPGSNSMTISRNDNPNTTKIQLTNELRNWPVQIKLAPIKAPYFEDSNLLIAADCCAYSYANFHHDFINNHTTLIGCPKLDDCDYSEKLKEIIKENTIKSITIARMTVPCCRGIEVAVFRAIEESGKEIEVKIVKISPDGNII